MCIGGPAIVSNTELRATTGHKLVMLQRGVKKLRWIGHALRKGDEYVAKQTLDWDPQGARRGTRKHTWKRTVVEETGKCDHTWSEVKCLAGNIVRWRCFSNAPCSCWNERMFFFYYYYYYYYYYYHHYYYYYYYYDYYYYDYY